MKKRNYFQALSAEITAAEDTGNRDTLLKCDKLIADYLAEGKINLPQAGELTADCEAALKAVDTIDGNTDHVRHVLTERRVDDL